MHFAPYSLHTLAHFLKSVALPVSENIQGLNGLDGYTCRLEEATISPLAHDRQYRQAAHYNVTHLRRQSFYSLPSAHIDILAEPPFSLPETFNAVDDAIDTNAELAEAILEAGLSSVGLEADDDCWKGKAMTNDMDKARSTIRQFYRDWSAEGLPERFASYSPILTALSTHLPPASTSRRHAYRVLVPGAGLGRLVFDVCAAGYTVQGNEISHHQLLASNYILNCTESAGQHKLYPWALAFSNHSTRSRQLQAVDVPDINPAEELQACSVEIQSELHHGERMSMTAGDFCGLYRQAEYEESFDAVTTCFFIDTAPNVISYIEAIKHCLKPGGIWANLGPLLWHFESSPTPAEKEKQQQKNASTHNTHVDPTHSHPHINNAFHAKQTHEGIGEPGSFELSNDEVIKLVEALGFDIVEQKEAPAGATGYVQDPASMLQNVYRPAFWVARKRR